MNYKIVPLIDNLYLLCNGKKQQLATRNKTAAKTLNDEKTVQLLMDSSPHRTAIQVKTLNDEKTVQLPGFEARIWNPRRSKLASAIHKKTPLHIKKTDRILYLGAASGTTVSYLSDILTQGVIDAVEISPVSMHKLLLLCEDRDNIIPIFDDANKPQNYQHIVGEVDMIYQDIAQRNQAEIALKNREFFLKEDGLLILVIKVRSIDVSKDAKEILKKELQILETELHTCHITNLAPYHKDHYMITAEAKNNSVLRKV